MITLRAKVPTIVEDCYMAPLIEAAANLISSGDLAASVELSSFVKGHLE